MGKRVAVRVTAHKAGSRWVARRTAATSAVAPGTLVPAGTPAVAGTPVLGQVLTLDPGAWTPVGDVAVQWLRDGVPVPGATGTTYRLDVPDVAARMSATTTVTRPGYTTATASAAPTAVVQSPADVSVAVRRVRRSTYLDVAVTATGVASVTGQVDVLRAGQVIGQAVLRGGVAHVALPTIRPGSRLFRIRYAGSPTVLGRDVVRRLVIS